MAIPCQAFVFQTKEGVETLRAATKVINWLRWRESPAHKRQKGGSENCSWEENLSLLEVAGSSPAVRTIYAI